VSGSTGVRAIFEVQSTAVNGARAGDSYDLDADGNHDNVADNAASPRFGSVVEWASASPTDTTGIAVGFPAPAFDWNTFQFYGLYAAFKDTAGASSSDILWLRQQRRLRRLLLFRAAGERRHRRTPFFDTIDETKLASTPTATATRPTPTFASSMSGRARATSSSSSTRARASRGPPRAPGRPTSRARAWKTITSPLVEDGTNLYFGGTDGSSARRSSASRSPAARTKERSRRTSARRAP